MRGRKFDIFQRFTDFEPLCVWSGMAAGGRRGWGALEVTENEENEFPQPSLAYEIFRVCSRAASSSFFLDRRIRVWARLPTEGQRGCARGTRGWLYFSLAFERPLCLCVAVVSQRYDPEVQCPGGFLGNNVLMRCNVPSFVRDHVTITSWLQEPSFNIYPSTMGGE